CGRQVGRADSEVSLENHRVSDACVVGAPKDQDPTLVLGHSASIARRLKTTSFVRGQGCWKRSLAAGAIPTFGRSPNQRIVRAGRFSAGRTTALENALALQPLLRVQEGPARLGDEKESLGHFIAKSVRKPNSGGCRPAHNDLSSPHRPILST